MNLLAVIVAAIAAFVIGFVLHSPPLGKLWMKLANIHPTGQEKMSGIWKQMLLNFVANLVTAFVLSGIIWSASTSPVLGPISWSRGALVGVWIWFGFLVTSTSVEVIWMGKNYKLWLYECGASLIAMAAMGAILAGW